MIETQAPIVRCLGCLGVENLLYYPEHDEDLCPECGTAYQRYDEARKQVGSALLAGIGPWLRHWLERGLTHSEAADLLLEEAQHLAGVWNEVAPLRRVA
jgi:hypothetical protein